MNALQIFQYNGFDIEFESINGQWYANATAMCKPFDREVRKWTALDSVSRYIDALSKRPENGQLKFTITKSGRYNSGTWIHEKLILKLAAWLDVDFEVWCDEKVAELIRTGSVTLKPLTAQEEMLLPFTERPVQLANSKEVNAYNFGIGGKPETIHYNRLNCYGHTGRTPAELMEWAKNKGIPARFRTSGKEVVRTFKPAYAASMSFSDKLYQTGKVSAEESVSFSRQHALPLFQKMYETGMAIAPAPPQPRKRIR
jgi:hypothetical protein